MKKIILLLILSPIVGALYPQCNTHLSDKADVCSNVNFIDFADEKACLKYFYGKIFGAKETVDIYFNSAFHLYIDKSSNKELCQGYSLNEIYRFIDNSKITTDGMGMSVLIEVEFPNKNVVYAEIVTDNGPNYAIACFYNTKGENLILGNGNYLYRPGIINDEDGYVNIRKEPSVKSAIVGKLYSLELFYFVPVSDTNWYKVYDQGNGNGKYLGYVHKKKIATFDMFPLEIKRKVEKERFLN